MQVFRKLSTFRGDAALSTWLYRIAVNTVLMHFRKKTRQYVSLDETYNQDWHLVHREYGSRDDHLSGCVHRIALTRAICGLPDGYRRIFLLHEVAGYEHQEIAVLLDCSIGNSKSQLHKAKRKIREFLGGVRAEDQKKKQSDVSDLRDTTSYTVSTSPPAELRPTVGMTSRFVAQTALAPEASGFAATS